jgi:phosphoribosylformylglycinamidine cyclo-ligase
VAFGRLEPNAVEAVVAGVAAGCRENGCALIGGETAEMPGVYTPPDFDLAGFIVGWVEEDAVLGADRVRDDDVIVGLASTGLHTNGYSLARRIVADRLALGPHDRFPESEGTVADALLAVHRSYLPALAPVLDRVHAMAHITGGGLPGNLDRALPPHLDAVIDTDAWDIPPLFRVLEREGGVARDEMYRTFNMGVGMTVITPAEHAGAVIASAAARGVDGRTIGRVRPGGGRVLLEGAAASA